MSANPKKVEYFCDIFQTKAFKNQNSKKKKISCKYFMKYMIKII